MRARLVEFVPGLLAGLVGGCAGYFLVAYLMASHGLWVPILPGAFAGLACGQLSPVASRRRGLLNALFVVGLVVYAQWKLFSPPFRFDGTLRDYALHLHLLPPITLLVMGINVVVAYWWGREPGIACARRYRAASTRDVDLDRL